MVLDDILEVKRKEIAELKQRMSLETIRQKAETHRETKRSLRDALSGPKLNLICELKKASPSEGVIRAQFDPTAIAKEFESAGAAAISVLTERKYFEGNPEYLKALRPVTTVPLLRKDFILEDYQIYEAALLGADAFLIIVGLVLNEQLKKMLIIAKHLNLEVLVEIHTAEELECALKAGSEIIGINNRDLKTLKIDLSVSERLIKRIPKGIIAVIESGVESREQITHFQSLGAHNFLVGTALMKSINIKEKINELLGTNGVRRW